MDEEDGATMKAIVVMNGQFYSGESVGEDHKLNFSPDRSKAVVVDQRRLRYIVNSILRWFMADNIKLQRLEILEVTGGKDKCANVESAKLEPANAKIV